jgi:hypothetical protein
MMAFELKKSIEILSRTPSVLSALLDGLSDAWLRNNEGENTWSPFDVVGHLIHGEKTDWIPRLQIILSNQSNTPFESFDRFAQFENSKGKSIQELLSEFSALRKGNILLLESKQLSETMLSRQGVHPSFGAVTLRQLLATWTAHDLSHIAQITRVMAKQYTSAVGPWKAYLPILTR